MTKIEYIKQVKDYCEKSNISVYDYYLRLAKGIRSNEKLTLTSFETRNPFMTSENIYKLIYTEDPRITEYYADIMTRVVDACETEDRKQMIREEVERKMAEDLSRKDIAQMIDEKLEGLTRQDIEGTVNEELAKQPERKVIMTSISTDTTRGFNGFTVIRESKVGEVHLFYFDGKNDMIKGETKMPAQALKVPSGYYINYEEFMEKMLADINEKYPTVEEVKFVKDEKNITLPALMEEVFVEARKKGALRFGKALETQALEHYQDLAMNQRGVENYQSYPLQTGVYVRRDVLAELLSKYELQVTVLEQPTEKGPAK